MATHGRSREPNDPLQRYGSHEPQRQMRDLLMQWDAIGVAELDGPVDEYDCMIDPQTRCRVGLSPRRSLVEWWETRCGPEVMNGAPIAATADGPLRPQHSGSAELKGERPIVGGQ